MTVTATANYVTYAGTGGIGPFPVPFRFMATSYLMVVKTTAAGVETTLRLNTDYLANGADLPKGGNVLLNYPLGIGEKLTILPAVPIDQQTVYVPNDPFPAKVHERALDKLTMIAQSLKASVARTLTFPFVETGSAALAIPHVAARKGKMLGFSVIDGSVSMMDGANFKGDPGGNVMAIGLFINGAGMNIPAGTDTVRTSGYFVKGFGVAEYAADAAVNAAYVTANPRSSFITRNGRGFRLIAEGWVDVTWFGARGDDTIDDTVAIQAAVDFLIARNGGTLFFPRGDYKISAPILCGNRSTGANRVVFQGAGGVGFGGLYPRTGSRIFGTHSGDMFRFESGEFVAFDKITFSGYECQAIRHVGDPGDTAHYLSKLSVTDCHFFGDLAECIFGNLIFAWIERNTFGFFGTVGPGQKRHRHICSAGTDTNTVNINRVINNLFFHAKGTESCLFDSGANLLLANNDWEQNRTLPIRLLGIQGAKVRGNWFEKNFKTLYEIEVGNGVSLIDSSGLSVDDNTFVHAGFAGAYVSTTAGSNIVTVTGAPTYGLIEKDNIVFADGIPDATEIVDFGTGTGTVGSYILSAPATKTAVGVAFRGGVERVVHFNTDNFDERGWTFNDNCGSSVLITNRFGKLRDQYGAGVLKDVSGAGLAWAGGGAHRFKRTNNAVTVVTSFAFPANASSAPNVIAGLPFACAEVAVAPVLTDRASSYVVPVISNPPTQSEVQAIANALGGTAGAVAGTNAGTDSFTLFKAGSLTPFTNAELSGKLFYVTITYFV